MRSGVRLEVGKRAMAAIGRGEVRLRLAFEVGGEVNALDLRQRSYWSGMRTGRFFCFCLCPSLDCVDGCPIVDFQQVQGSPLTGPFRLYLLQFRVLLIILPLAFQSLRPVPNLLLVFLLQQLLLVHLLPLPPHHLRLQRLQSLLVDPTKPLVEFLPIRFLSLPATSLRILIILQNPMKIPPSDQGQPVIAILAVPDDKVHLNFIIPKAAGWLAVYNSDIMEQTFSTISITMPKVKISHLEHNTFIYEVDVATRWAKWHLEKKFVEFQDLHKKLNAEFNDLPEFPSSILSFFVGESEEQASENQEILEEYLQATSKRKDIINTSVYVQFLQLDKHSPMMLARKPKFLQQFQMEERINDQGKVILDYFYHQDFIVFATGNDNPMEKFNSLVANTKFPWESEDEIEYVLPLGTVQCWLRRKDGEELKYKRVWARNYPIETRCFIFSTTKMTMIVGLSDGSIELFRLIQKPRYIYYEMPKMVKTHEEEVVGLHLDEVNMMLYSASTDGWLNVIDVSRGILVDTLERQSGITHLIGDGATMRLFVGLAQGNIEIFEYSHSAKVKLVHSVSLPAVGEVRSLLFDSHRSYLFAGCFQSGEVFIFEVGKKNQEKLTKQIGFLKNKEQIIDLLWQSDKMQLLVCTKSGEIFFWDTVRGQQVYMLKAYEDSEMSKTRIIRDKNMIITASRGRKVKFWEIPAVWRDAIAVVEEDREIEIRRKVENMYKVREAVKRKQVNSDQDDLKGWHWGVSSSDEDQ